MRARRPDVDVFIERCAGIDIGKNEVVACVRIPGSGGRGRCKQTRTFSSFTAALEEMADWFTAEGVTEIAMEATGRTGSRSSTCSRSGRSSSCCWSTPSR
jgi:hypothetical protein